MKAPALYMGACRVIQQAPSLKPKKGTAPAASLARSVTVGETEKLLHLPAHHLTTHFITVGASGCGKTALGLVTAEEAMRASIPVLMIDVKGDLPNLLLSFPNFDAVHLEPWVTGSKNAGIWCIGRLQTDAARERVTDGLLTGDKHTDALLDTTVARLVNRSFVLRNVRDNPEPVLFNPRYAVSHLRGPMTRIELQRALAMQAGAF